jgi:cobalt-precorrin 5A hydrolase
MTKSDAKSENKIAVVALTLNGCHTALRLGELLKCDIYLKSGVLAEDEKKNTPVRFFEGRLAELIAEIFPKYDSFVMIMATGIVFRMFAPYAEHKTTDPAVLVIDEKARFVISLLSGHLGGANALTARIAALLGATPVITTATDINEKPSFDVVAKENDCAIANICELKYISSALVNGEKVGLHCDLPIDGNLPPDVLIYEEYAASKPLQNLVVISSKIDTVQPPQTEHILRLVPRNLILGIGCKRGTPFENIEAALTDFLHKHGRNILGIKALATIDLKKDEPGLLALAEKYKLPFLTYTAEELAAYALSNGSDFVQSVTGTPSVSEAAALLASGGKTLVPKTIYPGITLSLAEMPKNIKF